MPRYPTYDYDDPDPTPWWLKVLAVAVICLIVRVLLWVADKT